MRNDQSRALARGALSLLFGIGLVFFGAIGVYGALTKRLPVAAAQSDELTVAPAVPMAPILEHAERSIDAAAPKIAPGRRKVLAKALATVAEDVFKSRQHQEYWIALVGVESAYNSTARSPVGAVGLGQLMPQYAGDFGAHCGLEGITKEHIADDFTNLMLSACYFRHLIESQGGSIPLALVAYNAGPHSPSLKRVKNGGSPVEETGGYVTKVWVSRDSNKRKE